MSEIERCRNESDGLFFITLISEKYSFCPFPSQIPADEFESFISYNTNKEDEKLLTSWFLKDENKIPNVYVLQPIDSITMKNIKDDEYDNEIKPKLLSKTNNKEILEENAYLALSSDDKMIKEWFVKSSKTGKYHLLTKTKIYEDYWYILHIYIYLIYIYINLYKRFSTVFPKLKEILRKIALVVLANKQDRLDLYVQSVTEAEVKKGLLSLSEEERNNRTFFYKRILLNMIENNDINVIKRYTDLLSNGKIDDEANKKLILLRDKILPNSIKKENMKVYEIDFNEYLKCKIDDDENDYLPSFLNHFCNLMCENIEKIAISYMNQKRNIPIYNITLNEIQFHSNFLRNRLIDFSSTTSTNNAINSIFSFLTTNHYSFKSSSSSSESNYFVLYGGSGLGKTSIMCNIIEKTINNKDLIAKSITSKSSSSVIIIYRFLGITPASANARNLMKSIILQLRLLFDNSTETTATTTTTSSSSSSSTTSGFSSLKSEFLSLLNMANENKGIILFLDSIDQLTDEDDGRFFLSLYIYIYIFIIIFKLFFLKKK